MRLLCADVQNDNKYRCELEEKFERFVKEYREYYSNNKKRLSDTLALSFRGEAHPPELKADETRDVNDFYTKVEATLRIILSLYSIRPINCSDSQVNWMNYHANFNVLIELVSKQLIDNNEGKNLALAVFLNARDERNEGTHSGSIAEVPSFIRMLNVYREMLVFLDPDLEGTLPQFDYPETNNLDIQWFLSDNKLNPAERTLVLIVGTLHDLSLENRKLIANIPWTVVVDLDAASDQGGLYDAVDDKARINRVLWTNVLTAPTRIYGASFITTEWYSCGDFIGYKTPISNNRTLSSYFTAANQRLSYSTNYDDVEADIVQLYMKTIQSLSNSPFPVTIVHIDDDFESVLSFLPTVKVSLRGIGYSFIGVYPTKQDNVMRMSSMISGNMQNNLDKFNYFCCDLPCFFAGLNMYKNHLPLIHSNKHRKTLPARDGDMEIPANRIQSLNRYFDVLYGGCDKHDDPEKYQSDKYDFRSGKIAPWSIFATPEGAVSLFTEQEEYYKKIIVEKLSKADRKNIVRIEHEPGIGGTTFCRKLCHSLHRDWPVVCVMKCNISEMAQELDTLYDILKKGIVILADNMDANDVEKLSSELYRSQTKPFCIVTGMRKNGAYSQSMPLSLLSDKEIEGLKRLYYEVSELPDKRTKNEEFNKYFSDSQMCNPFMIALYFLEENFFGVSDYVGRSLNVSETPSDKKVIAYAALFHIYNGKYREMPENFAKYVVGLEPTASYLGRKEYAKSLLISNTKGYITSKHILISKEILKQTAICLYSMPEKGDYKNYIYKFVEDFIEDFFGFLRNKALGRFLDEHSDILRGLFTTSDNESSDNFSFSKLISAIGLNANSEIIFNKVIKSAENYLDCCRYDEDKDRLYQCISHLYGHMGRFYRAPTNIAVRNLSRSGECAAESIEYMKLGHANDPFIYHMSGEAFRMELKDKLNKSNNFADELKADEWQEKVCEMENLFSKAVEMYDYVINGHSYQFGYISMLHLYIDFVGSMYRTRDGSDNREWLLEPEKEDEYHNDIENIIETLGSLELDEESIVEFDNLVDRYYSGQYIREDAVDYYEGKVNSNNISPEQLKSARFSLLYARLRRWKNDPTQSSELIMNLLDKLCGDNVNFDAMSYRDRRGMMFALRQWLFFARLNNKEVQAGIVMAEKWAELCQVTNHTDPRPFYNLYVLNYLKILDGFENCVTEAEKHRAMCDRLAEQSKGVFGRKQTVRDCLVGGIKMGRLYPCHSDTRIYDQTKLTKLTGRLEKVSAAIGYIQVARPERFLGRAAKFRLSSKVSVREAQISHRVEFYGAFTYEQLTAYYDIVSDIDAQESLTEMYGMAVKEASMPIHSSTATPTIVPISSTTVKDSVASTKITSNVSRAKKTDSTILPFASERVLFYPKMIGIGRKGNKERKYLNGTIIINGKKFKAGFNVNDLYDLQGDIGESIDCANEILNKMRGNGFMVYCKPRNSEYYSVLIKKSFCSIEELMADSSVEPESQPEFSMPKSVQIVETKTKAKLDNSFLKGKTVDFLCERKDGKRIAGKFTYNEQEYNGKLNCMPKEIKMLLGKKVKAVVVIASETVILNKF